MAKQFNFDPPTGLRDKGIYPTNPGSEDAAREQIQRGMDQLKDYINKMVDTFYPIGSIYTSISPVNPSVTFGGTWSAFASGKTLVGVDETQDEFKTVEQVGGEKSHKLTDAEMQHKHGYNNYYTSAYSNGNGNKYTTGESVSSVTQFTSTVAQNEAIEHNNLQPYITVYMWKRIA